MLLLVAVVVREKQAGGGGLRPIWNRVGSCRVVGWWYGMTE